MTRIEAKHIDDVPQLKDILLQGAETMGFMSEDGLIMAHCPEMLGGTSHMIRSILGDGQISPVLKRMIGFIFSQSSGCQYCSAHTSYTAVKHGIEKEKLDAIWEYPSSDLFNLKEKAALQLAHHSSVVPNQSTDADFDELKKHFSTEEIVELVFTISLYSFLNTFNSTIKTTIEEEPLSVYKTLQK